MYIVLKSFAGKEYSGTKGKLIEIKDKDFAKSLIKAGFIAEYSKQDKKNADKDKEIVELKSTISKLTDENTKLEEEKAELILKVQELENASADASTDDTVKILEEYKKKDSRITVYNQEENIGSTNNFEFLLTKVQNDYYMLSDQDDIWEKEKIEKSVKKIKETNADLVFSDLAVVDENLNIINESFCKLKNIYSKIKKDKN